MDKNRETLPPGLSILRYFYLLNVVLFGITILLFYKDVGIMVLGFILPPVNEIITKFILIIFPFYIYLDLKKPNIRVFSLMVCYHFFFLINSIFTFYYIVDGSIMPLLQIVNKSERTLDVHGSIGYTVQHVSVHILSIITGVIILFYISSKKFVFLEKD